MDTKTSIAEFVDSSVDQIVEWSAVDPKKVIEEFQAAGFKCTDGRDIEQVQDLRDVRLGDAEKIARRFIKTNTQLAAGQGFATGIGGLITIPVSVPADAAAYVGWLARTASAVQLSYGFDHRTETADAQLKLAMLAGVGVSSVTIQGTEVLVTQLAKKVMTTPYHSAPMQAAVKSLAAKVGINLTHKSFAKAVPLVGGAINGSVQGGLVNVGGKRILSYYKELASLAPQ